MPDLLSELPKLTSEQRAELVRSVDELNVADGRFQHRAEACDVVSKERLRRFRVEKLKWRFWLYDDKRHAIFNHVVSLLWDYAFFTTLNDLRVSASKTAPQDANFNEPMFSLLVSGFVAKQAMGIRRLIDRREDVVSLKRLLHDLKKNRDLITREVYVAQDGLPYDYAPVKEGYEAGKTKEGGTFFYEGVETTGPKAWGQSERVHKVFDRLTGISPSQRTRDDMLPTNWFDDLVGKLDVCRDLHKFADKFIAHAADSNSRNATTEAQKVVTIAKLTECYKAIVTVGCEVSCSILGDGTPWAVPQPQFDVVENLDKGWVPKVALPNARKLWEKHRAAISKWSR
jgi:hypothetical protein